ncbi:hypothetical protein CEXT_419461 [Caerostris extrusa]|uniref:Uncharacterized protein n=1 Tax=Caerostris extrusa TaxID=172846 RepID=A0AAV4N8C2_CAEEX|nr:hypothetical protein CEXT_419461 [Caerostris extrusa]
MAKGDILQGESRGNTSHTIIKVSSIDFKEVQLCFSRTDMSDISDMKTRQNTEQSAGKQTNQRYTGNSIVINSFAMVE